MEKKNYRSDLKSNQVLANDQALIFLERRRERIYRSDLKSNQVLGNDQASFINKCYQLSTQT